MRCCKYTFFSVFFIASLSLLGFQEKISPNYRVGPQDMIEITVFGHDEWNRSVRVSEEGKIPFPFIGEIDINGLTRLEIEKKLKTAIDERLLVNAQVIVFIKEFHSQKISLFGAVGNQGQYELEGPETLLSLLSKAGGMTENAGEDILVIRQLPDKTTRSLKISIHDLMMNGDPALDIPLQTNDKINVPKAEMVKLYFVGEVMIKRMGPDGKEQVLKFNVRAILKGRKQDVPLKDNDTIYVPETIF